MWAPLMKANAAKTQLVTLREAADAVGKSADNIRDYVQRGRIKKYDRDGAPIERAKPGELRVDLTEVRVFLSLVRDGLEKHHHAGLAAELGFYNVTERERTKHVHRLHPYLGKFIPQLVEWFLRKLFKPGDVIIDPFMGSATTLVQANELGIDSIGVDISDFNCRIAEAKTGSYDLVRVEFEVLDAERRTAAFSRRLFPSDDRESPVLALPFESSNQDEVLARDLVARCESEYLKTWFAPRALVEILYYKSIIESQDYQYRDLLRVLLSRAVRSSRLIPHNDLATPKAPLPVGVYYYCEKHDRQCIPIDNCITKIHAYSRDTIRRIEEFKRLRTNAAIHILRGDSREIDLETVLHGRKVDGVFTSPPYVGQIDYHAQHSYAYDLFDIPRQDHLEIGPKSKGKSKQAKVDYSAGIAAVLKNIRPHLKPNAPVAIVANDKHDLYPAIAELAGFTIDERFHRAVTKRTEKGGDPYQETVFVLRAL